MLRIFVPALGRVNTQNRDGSEIRFTEVAKRWPKDSAEISILLPQRELPIIKNEGVAATYHVLDEPIRSERDSFFNVLLIYGIRMIQAIQHKIKDEFGVVYCPSDFLVDLIPAVNAKRRNKGAKLVVCLFLVAPNPFRGYEFTSSTGYRRPTLRGLIYFLTQRFSVYLIRHFADLVLVLNSKDKHYLSKYLPEDKIKVVSMGVDYKSVASLPKKPKSYDGIFLGRLHPQKGLPDLIKIWRLVCDQQSAARLVIIGGGSEKWFSWLKSEIAQRNLSRDVEVLGPRFGEEKFALLKSSKLFLMPSYYESWGMVACEAMACGLPVVAYDLPIFVELFPKGMIRVPIKDVEAFASACLKLLNDEDLYRQVAAQALETSSAYDWDKIAVSDLNDLTKLKV
ncbi:MAG: glycosyltransferase family 4 protein [Actinobacteria bacterium]|nr:glycosyltransferase family 4 protein [Actinomycetota bacterium]